jgi:hypothetical protein
MLRRTLRAVILPLRHPEPVSGSIVQHAQSRKDKWTLKHVQGDGGGECLPPSLSVLCASARARFARSGAEGMHMRE